MRGWRAFRALTVMVLLLVGAAAAPLAASAGRGGGPANDTPAGATRVVSLPFDDALDISFASAGPGDARCAGERDGRDAYTVWYAITPRRAMTVAITTDGSQYDTTLAVASVGLGQLACNDDDLAGVDGNDYSSAVRLDMRRGRTYYVMVGSYYDPYYNAECACPGVGAPLLRFHMEELP